jgi:hypothetical protein
MICCSTLRPWPFLLISRSACPDTPIRPFLPGIVISSESPNTLNDLGQPGSYPHGRVTFLNSHPGYLRKHCEIPSRHQVLSSGLTASVPHEDPETTFPTLLRGKQGSPEMRDRKAPGGCSRWTAISREGSVWQGAPSTTVPSFK